MEQGNRPLQHPSIRNNEISGEQQELLDAKRRRHHWNRFHDREVYLCEKQRMKDEDKGWGASFETEEPSYSIATHEETIKIEDGEVIKCSKVTVERPSVKYSSDYNSFTITYPKKKISKYFKRQYVTREYRFN